MADINGIGRPDIVMFDERVDTTEGCLERRKPVGLLLRDVQKHLQKVHRPLRPRCERLGVSNRGTFERAHSNLNLP